jgi:hypothetical protein
MKAIVADNLQPTKISTVALQSLYPAHLKYIGLSGQEYQWEKAGDVVHVLEEDAPALLSKKHIHRGCCGVYSEGNLLLQKYEEAVNA